jgi:hypothetical protein
MNLFSFFGENSGVNYSGYIFLLYFRSIVKMSPKTKLLKKVMLRSSKRGPITRIPNED